MGCDIVITGHVDHGKSTLLGRILLDRGSVPSDKLERVRVACQRKGIEFEPAFLLDALKEEQEQGISIDTTRVCFEESGRSISIIDAPGHLDFLKNMASGASSAVCAVVVVDVNEGIRSQTERHLKVLSVLGVKKVIVAVNKMDLVNYDQAIFESSALGMRTLLESLQFDCIETVPIAALPGINISEPDEKLSWYCGPPLVPLLTMQASLVSKIDLSGPLRVVLQDVYKLGAERQFVGKVVDGTLSVGEEVFFSPSGKLSKILRIIKADGSDGAHAKKGDSVALILDNQIFVERGEVASRADNLPIVDTAFVANLVWFSAQPIDSTRQYLIKVGTNQCFCSIVNIEDNAAPITLKNGDIATVKLNLSNPLAFDINGSAINRFAVCTEFETVAAGTVVSEARLTRREERSSRAIPLQSGFIGREDREFANGHKGAVLWLTGLSGAGKTTLARALERGLFTAGVKCTVLDGDNLRTGICADLGFSPEDRSENVHRIAHVARLFVESGFITIVACISPYERDRQEARRIIGSDSFNEVFVFCPLEVCVARDAKGLYKGQKKNEVTQLTGIDAPYQPPACPEARVDSSVCSVEEGVRQLVNLLVLKNVIGTTSCAVILGDDYANVC